MKDPLFAKQYPTLAAILEASGAPKLSIKNPQKAIEELSQLLKQEGLTPDFTNAALEVTFTIPGSEETFTYRIHDDWVNVGNRNSEVGSARDPHEMQRLVDYIKKSIAL